MGLPWHMASSTFNRLCFCTIIFEITCNLSPNQSLMIPIGGVSGCPRNLQEQNGRQSLQLSNSSLRDPSPSHSIGDRHPLCRESAKLIMQNHMEVRSTTPPQARNACVRYLLQTDGRKLQHAAGSPFTIYSGVKKRINFKVALPWVEPGQNSGNSNVKWSHISTHLKTILMHCLLRCIKQGLICVCMRQLCSQFETFCFTFRSFHLTKS